jgi:hypothetical protein
MITINRSLVLASALAATALVVAFETGSPRAANPPTLGEVVQRFPLPGEMFTPVALTTYLAPKFIAAQKVIAAQQAHRPPMSELCAATPKGWPYVSRECLVAAGGPRVPSFMRS